MKTKRFERISRGWRWSLLLALVALGCGGPETSEDGLASSGAEATISTAPDFSPTFFSARQDVRKCAFPMCGGYFVASVNQSLMRCPSGAVARECYVSSIDLSALDLPSDQEAQVRKAIGFSPDVVGVLFQGKVVAPPAAAESAVAPAYAKLIAAHAWLAPAPAAMKGVAFGLADSGIVCIRAPCPSIRGLVLNQKQQASFSRVDLTGAPGTDEEKAAALADLSNGNGLIAVGPRAPTLDTRAGSVLRANQFFQIVKPSDPCATVKCSSGYHCEPKVVECLVAPCPSIGVCVADPVQPVRCGGIAGIKCAGEGQCVDDPSDGCDPSTGGADCGGLCVCKQTIDCAVGTKWNDSPSVCACERILNPIPCGKNVCGDGEYCCNESCGICAPRGAMCIQIYCGELTAQ